MSKSNIIHHAEVCRFRLRARDYKYGLELGGQGIMFEELCEDWPEVLQNADVMRGWDDAMQEILEDCYRPRPRP
jgi:hypothetical protein